MGKVLPSQRLLEQFEERLVFGDMNLSEIVRSGAQMMLQYALEREVTEALGRGYYENAPETTKEKGRRNGYESHRVLTGEGAVTVQVPQIRETSTGFRSKILDAYVSRTEKLDELIARMYVHGMSTRDIEATFADVLSGTGVSKSVVSRVTQCLSDDFEVFRKRDLSSEELLYLELDGTFLRYHQGAEKKEPILVATGYRIDGTRVLLHIGVGNGESYANWKGFLQEMVARGLREPLLIVTDGNPGVLKAIEEVFPQSLKQRCQKHRLENILGKAPKEIQMGLFDERNLFEVTHPDFPNERLVACRNPELAERRRHKRRALLEATCKELEKVCRMVERRRLQGKENIRAAVKKLLNKYKVGSYYRLDIRDDGFDFELDETTMDADASRLASGNSELANKRLQRWKRHVETIAKQLDQIRQRIGRGQLHGKDKIGVRVGKVLNKYKVGKHFTLDIRDNSFSFEIDDTKVTAEAALDGFYVIRTSLAEQRMKTDDLVRSYKLLVKS